MPKVTVTNNVRKSPVSGSCQRAVCAGLALHSKITVLLPCGATLKRFKLKFLIDNWMLISVALASGGMLLWPLIAESASAGKLSPTAAVQLINRSAVDELTQSVRTIAGDADLTVRAARLLGKAVLVSSVIRGSEISRVFGITHDPSSMAVGQSCPSVHEDVNGQVVQPVSVAPAL